MRAAIYDEFRGPIEIRQVSDPSPSRTGVVLAVKACGICRSDWHGWMGNDPDIHLPHVPGHELAGEVVEVGAGVSNFKIGDLITVPFVAGCGNCEQCNKGDHQICDHQFQPGFTGWGGFAEYVALEYATNNLVTLPVGIDLITAASLGCRFATSFRAIIDQGQVQPGQWVAVWACGGVGLSAIMIAAAMGARVVAMDVSADKLAFAQSLGAEAVIDSSKENAAAAVLDVTSGGAHVSVDALGHPEILTNSVSSLRKRGKHIQVGIMDSGFHRSAVPVDKIISRELEVIGSHGMQAHRYPEMLQMIIDHRLQPEKLIGRTISLDEAPAELMNMNKFAGRGVTVIDLSL